MPSYTLEYPKETFNTVKRYNPRASYALETIHTIINTCPILHVSFNTPDPSSPYPMTLPMIGFTGSYVRPSADIGDVQELYLHGYVSNRLMRLSTDSNVKGLPVTIAASIVDGFVLAGVPNDHSYNYRSAVVFGHATLVTDHDEKLWAMEKTTNSVVPDRWENSHIPPIPAEMSSTGILKVKIDAGSAKIRHGGPSSGYGDGDEKVWRGVLPVYQTIGEPVPMKDREGWKVPEYITHFVKDHNEACKQGAEEAAVTPMAAKATSKDKD